MGRGLWDAGELSMEQELLNNNKMEKYHATASSFSFINSRLHLQIDPLKALHLSIQEDNDVLVLFCI